MAHSRGIAGLAALAALLELERCAKFGALLVATEVRRGTDDGHWN